MLSMIIRVIKIVELCSDFSYGPWFKRYAQKNEGPLAALSLLDGEVIIVGTKTRGSLGFLGAKVNAKVRRIGFFLDTF